MKKDNVKSGSKAQKKESGSFWKSILKGFSSDFLPIRNNEKRLLTLEETRRLYAPPRTLGAPQEVQMALDSQIQEEGGYSLLQHTINMGVFGSANFLGYGALESIAQHGLIRACIETVADDMTRNWIELSIADANGGKPESDTDGNGIDDRIDAIKAEMERLGLRDTFHAAASMTGYYGGCLLYIEPQNSTDITAPLVPDVHSLEAKDGTHWIKSIKIIDPVDVFPGAYNSVNPLADDYYKPSFWWVQGRRVHASRLIRVVANEPPQLLLPSYNFFGIPQAQILWDYVAHFQKNRDAANRFYEKFSMLIFKTDMADIATTTGGLDMLNARMEMLARYRSNDGVIAIDGNSEDIITQTSPLSGLTDMPRQSLEFVAALNRTPVVKLLGISPGGFNATGESDIRNYYDHILSQQEKVFRKPLMTILDLIQHSLFGGDAVSGLEVKFMPLSVDEKRTQADLQKLKTDSLCALLDRDIISPEEARRILASDAESMINGIDVEEPLEPEDMPDGSGSGDVDEIPDGGEVLDAPKEKANDVEKVLLNGAQVQSMVEIVSKVATGELPRDSGLAILQAAFPITAAVADEIIGSAGLNLPEKEETEGAA